MSQGILVYLDHNILDSMLKGDVHLIKNILAAKDVIPIYSEETIKEIKRSVGYEKQFLSLLDEIKAQYLEPILENNLLTGDAQIHCESAFDIYNFHLENADSLPEYGYGFTAMLQKMHGGRNNESFEEIFNNGMDEYNLLIKDAIKELDDIDELSIEEKQQAKAELSEYPKVLGEQFNTIAKGMDKHQGPLRHAFEAATNIGPKVLNNIVGPNILEKIFKLIVENMPETVSEKLEIDTFFGIKPQPYEANPDRERTPAEKVNGIYHQLNFLGFHRDSKMHKERGFVRSNSDMTHARVASFCHYLFCRDLGMIQKTSVAYDYLNVKTKIVYFSPKKKEVGASDAINAT